MIQLQEQFYCVGCQNMIPTGLANVLFRTGFFRVVNRLGCCRACAQAQAGHANKLEAQLQSVTGEVIPLTAKSDYDPYQTSFYPASQNLLTTEVV